MSTPRPTEDHSAAIGPRDGAIFMLVLALGAAGYLCDAHSPLVQPLLPLLGLFFAGAGLSLLAICVFQAARYRQAGWLAGATFGIFPLIALIVLVVGAILFGLIAPTGPVG